MMQLFVFLHPLSCLLPLRIKQDQQACFRRFFMQSLNFSLDVKTFFMLGPTVTINLVTTTKQKIHLSHISYKI